jgi:DNA polymerase
LTQLEQLVRAKGLNYVGSRGDPRAKVVIVGEAPGADEDQQGLPFVGTSGKELDRMLADAGWRKNEPIRFTNVFKIRPPSNDASRIAELGISPDVFVEDFLDEIRATEPAIIIAAGATALGALCNFTLGKDGKARIGVFKGSLLRSPALAHEHYVIPVTHPAFVLREWSERPIAVFCLERAREEYDYFLRSGALRPLPERKIRVSAPFEEVSRYLRGCLEPVRKRVSIDIETPIGLPYCIAVAVSPSECMSFMLNGYTDDQTEVIWTLLNDVLRFCPQIGQNYIAFDCHWLEWLRMEPNLEQTDDSMILAHVLNPELPRGLQFLTMIYTREPYYKDEGHKWKPKHGLDRLMRYNALDACVTYEVMLAMEAELEERCAI